MDELAQRVVDAITEAYHGDPGHRAAHAKGFCVAGSFAALPVAASLCRAPHLRGGSIPVTARFSNGSGNVASADYHLDARGLAVRFHLPGGGATDLVAISQRAFFVRTPEDFLEFTRVRNDPGGMGDFLIRHPEAQAAVVALLQGGPPASYATLRYDGLHAFRWLDATGGSRWIRYRWRPEAGEQTLDRAEAKDRGRDYLRPELESRLAAGPVAFALEVAVAEEGDGVDDPTAEWPAERRLVECGRLQLTAPAVDQEGGCEGLVFDPLRLVDGIEPSADPILNFRPRAYDVSASRRLS